MSSFEIKKNLISFIFGGLLFLGNYWALTRTVKGFFGNAERKTSLVFFSLLKYPLLVGILAFSILKTPLHPVAFVVGFLVAMGGVLSHFLKQK